MLCSLKNTIGLHQLFFKSLHCDSGNYKIKDKLNANRLSSYIDDICKHISSINKNWLYIKSLQSLICAYKTKKNYVNQKYLTIVYNLRKMIEIKTIKILLLFWN